MNHLRPTLRARDNLIITVPMREASERASDDGSNTSTILNQKDLTSIPPRFRRKSVPHIKTIMRLLREGRYPAHIAKIMGKSKSFVHYYVKKLEEFGYIEKEESVTGKRTRGVITLYSLTQPGTRFLAERSRMMLWCPVFGCTMCIGSILY